MVIADIPTHWLNRARKIALALPEATEVETWDHPTFRVRNKIFLGMGAGTHGIDFVPSQAISDGHEPLLRR